MQLEEDLKQLSNYECFARFLQMIEQLREETIEELHNADSTQIQQISGRILTYDQVLQMCNWRSLKLIHGESLK